VNGTLYSYQVLTNHPGNGFPDYEDAEEVAVVEAPNTPNPAVAGGSGVVGGFSLPLGGFYTGITRDDAGGLRYLYGTNNMNVERPLNDTLVAVTNKTSMTNVVTQDLGLLTERSYGTTLTPAQIIALYPGILIEQSFSRYTNVTFTNYVGDNVIINNVTTNVFDYTYANVLTNVVSATSQIITQVVEVAPAGFVGPGGSLLVTNLVGTRTTNTISLLSGEFTIVPTNLLGYQIVADLYTNFTEVTNIVVTNATARFTNTSSQVSVQTIDLASFTGVAMSNSPAQLAAAYTAAFPGQPPLLITSTNSYFTNVVTTTITNELISSPYDPVGVAPRYQLLTNYTTNVAQRFTYTFGNVVTNGAFFTGGVFDPVSNKDTYSATGQLLEVLTEWTKDPYSPAITTNLISVVTQNPVTSIFPNGSVYVVPTNLFGYNLLSAQLVTVTNLTNNIYSVVLTNGGNRVTNTLNLVRFVTNYFLTANPVQFVNPTNTGLLGTGQRQEWVRLVTNTFKVAFPITLQSAITTQPSLRRGVDKIVFQRMLPDSTEGPVY
ncbi:MAG: hypothetical protein HYZ36_08760, partial [Pedosphaera parvula]|nr:hypothetical protein [Pedosphaera parvula]